MVKRYYIQDYPENFRGNTETKTIASDFIIASIERSLTRREKKRTLDMWWGQVAFYKLLTWTGLENSSVATKKVIWKLLIFFHTIWWSFYVILAPSPELGNYTHYVHHQRTYYFLSLQLCFIICFKKNSIWLKRISKVGCCFLVSCTTFSSTHGYMMSLFNTVKFNINHNTVNFSITHVSVYVYLRH